jgi:hypothetical protein
MCNNFFYETKCVSATFEDFYKKTYKLQTGNGLTQDSGLPQDIRL